MISNEYKKIISDLNGISNFGKRKKAPKFLDKFIKNYIPKTVLDFGCGTGGLVHYLQDEYPDLTVSGYDPGNETYSTPIDNSEFDLIVSTDVLEHIEPEHLNETLQYLSERSRYCYHLIALAPSKVILPDGRNAHLIQQSSGWWRERFIAFGYKIITEYEMKHFNEEGRLVNKYFIIASSSNFTNKSNASTFDSFNNNIV